VGRTTLDIHGEIGIGQPIAARGRGTAVAARPTPVPAGFRGGQYICFLFVHHATFRTCSRWPIRSVRETGSVWGRVACQHSVDQLGALIWVRVPSIGRSSACHRRCHTRSRPSRNRLSCACHGRRRPVWDGWANYPWAASLPRHRVSRVTIASTSTSTT